MNVGHYAPFSEMSYERPLEVSIWRNCKHLLNGTVRRRRRSTCLALGEIELALRWSRNLLVPASFGVWVLSRLVVPTLGLTYSAGLGANVDGAFHYREARNSSCLD